MRPQPKIVAAAVLAAAIAGPATVAAQTPPGAPSTPATHHPPPGLSAKPYSRLFDQQLAKASEALRSRMRPNSARRFICGTPVLPADSTIDPKFEKPLPDTTTRFTIRVVPPSC